MRTMRMHLGTAIRTSRFARVAALAGLVVCSGSVKAETPDSLIPKDGSVQIASLHGVGFQVYTSKARADDPTKFQWVFKEPIANLYNDGGQLMVTHFAGPTWQSKSGSQVVGTVFAKVTPDPASIPWVLLSGSSHSGEGMLSEVTWIQRLDTVGGNAPSTDPTASGIEFKSPYTATYAFWAPPSTTTNTFTKNRR